MGSCLLVQGGSKVFGEIDASGAKNAALPILSAILLLNGKVTLFGVPNLCDVTNLIELLNSLGVKVVMQDDMSLQFDATNVIANKISDEIVSKMRASFLVLGPLLARFGRVEVPFPGGCAIGSRPLDLHLYGLKQLGAKIIMHKNFVEAIAPADGLVGGAVDFEFPSVTATENILMAAVLAQGITTIKGAAKEPEIVDLANFLNKIGADIQGSGTSLITIVGVDKLKSEQSYHIMGDRVEAGTFLIAAAMTKGHIKVKGIAPNVLELPLNYLKIAGANIICHDNAVELDMTDRNLQAVSIVTDPYPGFPTDLQAQWLALNVIGQGEAVVKEQMFENRFQHVAAMNSMGAGLVMQDRTVISTGAKKLYAAEVVATDLRASASLVLAALAATGVTKIKNICHIDRGYEHIESKLNSLGCNVTREDG